MMFACEGALLNLRTVLFSLAIGNVDVHGASVSLLGLPRLLLQLLRDDDEGRQE